MTVPYPYQKDAFGPPILEEDDVDVDEEEEKEEGEGESDLEETEEDALPDPMVAKKLIMTRLEAWVDQLLLHEKLPENFPEGEISEAEHPDFFTLLSSMTCLTEEFRVQARGYRKLQEEVALAGRIVKDAEYDRAHRVAEPTEESDLEKERVSVVKQFLDVHDRLYQTRNEAERRFHQAGRLAHFFGGSSVQKALIDGLQLTLDRFDETLLEFGMRRFCQDGDPFDPTCMKAVDAVHIPKKPAGVVLRVLRSGYFFQNKVIRFADVQVSK